MFIEETIILNNNIRLLEKIINYPLFKLLDHKEMMKQAISDGLIDLLDVFIKK